MDVTEFFGCPIYSSTDKLLIILFWCYVAYMLFVFILIASRLEKLLKKVIIFKMNFKLIYFNLSNHFIRFDGLFSH
jgi:hypothetical protein